MNFFLHNYVEKTFACVYLLRKKKKSARLAMFVHCALCIKEIWINCLQMKCNLLIYASHQCEQRTHRHINEKYENCYELVCHSKCTKYTGYTTYLPMWCGEHSLWSNLFFSLHMQNANIARNQYQLGVLLINLFLLFTFPVFQDSHTYNNLLERCSRKWLRFDECY